MEDRQFQDVRAAVEAALSRLARAYAANEQVVKELAATIQDNRERRSYGGIMGTTRERH